MRRNNYFFIVALLLIVGIGYAALSSNLGIRGLGSYKSNTWDVYLDNLIDNSAYSEVVSQASINEDKDSISFQVNLDDFEDKYIFYTDVVNNGTIDAMIDNLEVTGLSNEVKKFIDIKVTYKDGIAVNRYDLLKENSRDTLKVECSYKENVDITDLPDTDGSTSLTITIDYVLADVNAREREHGEGDVNAPTITIASNIKSGINSWVNTADFTYRIEDKDAVKFVKYCVSTEECTPNIEVELENNEFNYSFGTSNQSQLICVEAVDIFGNTSKECSDKYLVDTDVPVLTSINSTLDSDDITVEVTATDEVSGIAKYYFSKNGYSFEISDYPNYTFTNLDDGTYNITSYVVDTAGNVSNRQNQSITVAVHSVYAILYDDGTLSLNNNGNIHTNKTVTTNYGKLRSSYSWYTKAPWYTDRNLISIVDIENEILPTSTAYWFYQLSNLTEVLHGSNLNTSSVNDMTYMFNGTSNLETLDVSNWDTSNVTSMNQLFVGNTKLESLDVSNWNTSKVTNMANMFNGASNLETLDVSKWNISNVTNISNMFAGISKLTELDVSKWDTSKVTNMGGVFSGCRELSSIDVSDWNTENVTDMAMLFSSCSSIESLDLSKWDTSNVTLMYLMFYMMPSLNSLDISNFNTSKVTNMWSMFTGTAANFTELDLSNFDTSNVTNMNSMFDSNGSNSKLERIIGIENFNTSKVTDMSRLFHWCHSLKELDLSNWDTQNVTNMERMFTGDSNLTTLNVGGWDTSKVTNMANMFNGINKITTLNISDWNVSNVTNMSYMFTDSRYLLGLDLSKWDTRNVTDTSYMFSYTSQNATSKEWYYGPNSTSMYDAITSSSDIYLTFTYKNSETE